ncbi:hypothetical protein NDU88_011010 [Pleurodeles waltl]|uniref:Uncharacterized protein n=1 Tax=Pleurodeles waltl TaxID=8319 RepID=A0AAV7Q025_PLEWA|nr:hypothetical protein NDU88_011010 [Pleurodeles waltl]
MDRMIERIDKLAERLDQAERRTSELEDEQTMMASRQIKMDKLLRALHAKAEDLEARSWRNNVRIVGVTESTNIDNMERFVEQLLTDVLGRETFSTMFEVE